MALTVLHPLSEADAVCHTASVATTPIVAFARAPFRGTIVKVWSILGAAITGGDAAIVTAINGTTITGGGITIANASSAAGDFDSAVPTALNTVNEDDVISFTSTGATGTATPCTFGATIRRA
jgi:hypothetical protein